VSDKSIWQGIGNLMGGLVGGKSGSKAMTTIEQRCEVCLNALDPRWTKCPYCEAAKNASARSSRAIPEPPARPEAGGTRRQTQVDQGAGAAQAGQAASDMAAAGGGSSRRHTQVDSSPGAGGERHVGGGRRLVGIVTTFTWSRVGQLFKVFDGRNYAGSGVVSADNNNPCDIQITDDPVMSSAHFLILCQGGKHIISDNFSTNGTFVNGVQIDTRGIELPDNAVIKAGTTVFTFQRIHAAPGATTDPVREAESGGWKPGGREDTVM